MTTRIQSVAALAVTIGLLSACGGSSGESATTDSPEATAADTTPVTEPTNTEPTDTEPANTEPTDTDPGPSDPPSTEPADTDPPVTEPPATDPAAADLPEWASGQMATVESDTGPLELPVEVIPFCESSRSFHTAAKGLDYLDPEQVLSVQQLFAAMVAVVPVTIETAPSAELAAQPTAAQEQLATIVPALEQIGYDLDRLPEVDDPDGVTDALGSFAVTRASLEAFLVQACGADPDVLAEQAQGAADLAAETMGEVSPDAPSEPEEPVEAVPGTEVSNRTSSIVLSVPTDWTETKEFVDDYDRLVAAPDIAAFDELTGPGVRVLRGEGGFRDGGFVGRLLDLEFNLGKAGCTMLDERGYDDNTYRGQEQIYDCGNDDLDVRVFGGNNEDESLYAVVFLVQPAGEMGIRRLVVETFQVF